MTSQKQEYKPEAFTINRPTLNEFKNSLRAMSADQQQSLGDNTEMLQNMLMSESEV